MEASSASNNSAVLVVCENPFLCEMTVAWLQGAGYIVRGAHNEHQAIAALKSCRFDFVVLDVDIGYQKAADLLRAVDEKLNGGLLVLLTGAVRYNCFVQWISPETPRIAMEKPYTLFDLSMLMKAGLRFPSLVESVRRANQVEDPLPCGQGETVMIVGDDNSVLQKTEEMLARLGYEPVGYDNSDKALEALGSHPERFDLVLTDEWMSQLSGTQLKHRIKQLRPDLPVIVARGYGEPASRKPTRGTGVDLVLTKPYDLGALARTLAFALAHGRS